MDFSAFRKILAVNLKHNFRLPMGMALLIAVLTPVICNITGLNGQDAARPLEMFLCFAGAALLVPICLPEQDENIRDVIRSKKVDYLMVCGIRILYSVFFLALLTGGFVLVMGYCESDVTMAHFVGGFASALFLGAAGFAFAGFTGNVTVGYMAAFIYYLLNMALKEKLGVLFLFSMYAGKEGGKAVLLLLSAVVMVTVLVLMKRSAR